MHTTPHHTASLTKKIFSNQLYLIFTILVFSLSCNKSFPDKLEEPIKSQEIIEWFKGYSQKMPGAPEPVWSSAKKAFDKELMVVRIPLESGGGEIFFGKKMYGNNLEVKFYRQVGAFDSINKNFSGYYETIDMGNYEYHKLDFINGVKVKELRSKSVSLSDDTNSGTTTFDDRPSWLSAFWDCLKQYILSVPKWDSKQNEWICSCFCSDGGSPKKLEDPLSPGGGSIFPPTFFIPPTNLIPPRDWDPFPINPGGVGPGSSGGSNHIYEIIRQIKNKVPLSFSDEQYLLTNLTAANELIEIIKYDEEKEELAISVRLALSVLKNNSFNTEDILREYNVYHNQNYIESDPISDAIIRYFALKYATLKAENSNLPVDQRKTDLKLLYLTFSDAIHIGLDLLGFIPIGGEVFDVINGFTYHLEGDKTNAYLSYVSAIPWAGYAAAGVKAIKAGSVIIAVVGKKGFLVAGRVSQKAFRNACGAVGTQVGHHIIPFHENVQSHPLMQMAFRAGFDPNNAAINGKAIEAVRNSGNHNLYAKKIKSKFDDEFSIPPPGGWDPKSSKLRLEKVITDIKKAIDAQPGVHVDYLIF